MATWITHIRIGENLLNDKLSEKEFIAGTIGPDSGVPNEDYSVFDPPRNITHWRNGEKKIDCEDFYRKYLKGNNKADNKEYSFYLGYYVHLVTDILWGKFHDEIREKKGYAEELKDNPKFIWRVKEDWYGLDYLYLDKNPQSIFFRCFCKIDNVEDYLDHFPKDAFNMSVNRIKEYYLGENKETKENFIYLNEMEMDSFVENATKEIRKILLDRELI